MKVFASSVVLASCLVGFADAGFCDEGSSFSGWRCDGDTKKYCSCSTSSKGTKCDKTREEFCNLGCTWGACDLPPTPAPANEVCATTVLDDLKTTVEQEFDAANKPIPDSGTEITLQGFCPVVTGSTYFTWKDRQLNNDEIEAQFLNQAYEDVIWWDDLRLSLVQSDNSTYTTIADLPAAIRTPWTLDCSQSVKDQSCRSTFPQCKGDKGFNDECVKSCKKIDTCLNSIVAACNVYKETTTDIVCKTYKDFFPEDLDAAGSRKCESICATWQNDFVSGAASLATSVLAVAGIFASLM